MRFIVALTFVVLAPAGALAHGDAAISEPKDGARLKRIPAEVTVTYSETPAQASRFIVRDGCGDDVGTVAVRGKTLVATISDAQPGGWRVKWSVLSSEDGHRTDGGFGFRVGGRPDCDGEGPDPDIGDAGTPVPNAGGNGNGGLPPGVMIGAGAGIALIVLALMIRRSSSG